jgi:Tol biopolymer transport system component
LKLTTTLFAVPALVGLASTSAAFQATTTRVSVDSQGVQGNANSLYGVAISADGRFVAFASAATNLVAGDTNGFWDVFVRDRSSATTERVNVGTAGVEANGESVTQSFSMPSVSISADGRFVAFFSGGSNLVAGDTNLCGDVFVRDRASGTTERVSVTTGGVQGNNQSTGPSISADGRFVAFSSLATNLVAGITISVGDLYVRDRQLGTTKLVSASTGGIQGNSDSSQHGSAISAAGRFVAFGSWSTNLVAGDTNSFGDVFVRDLQSATTERASLSTGGVQGNGTSVMPSISTDGRFVAFESYAFNLVAGDTNGFVDIFVRDRQNATLERVSVSTSGVEGNSYSILPVLSADARFVAFISAASNLVAGDTNAQPDVFLRDRTSGTTEIVSISTSGVQANSTTYIQTISADGRNVAFESYASNLVAGDWNGYFDIFVRDRGPQVPTAYCTSGTSSHGCIASIAATVNPSLSLAQPCIITVTSVEGLKSGILFYGADNTGFTPGPWASSSTSWLCVKHPVQRTPIKNSGGTFNACDGSFALDWDGYQAGHPLALGNPWNFSDRIYVQAWFRDPLAVKSTNLSNALEMTYGP